MQVVHLLNKADQGKYIEVPFDVPAMSGSVSVQYQVKPLSEGSCTVDLGLVDPLGLRGWSGGARKSITVSPAQATPGYKVGPVLPGRWAAVLGAYAIPPAGCEVTLTVQVEPVQRTWIPGDLHLHTVHSDGRMTVTEVAERAHSRGLQFLALTDHNTSTQNSCITPCSPVTLIPGYEWTSYTGHANIYGLSDPVKDFRCADPHAVDKMLHAARQNGARVSLNHILDDAYASGVWRWGFTEADWVEIWNGPWRPSNHAALHWWDNELKKGRHLPAVGGSDFHKPQGFVDLGCPTTWVHSVDATADSILQAVNEGRAVISFDPAGPLATAQCGSCTIGDTVDARTLATDGLHIDVERGKGDRLILVSAQGPVITLDVDTDAWSTKWTPPHGINIESLLYLRLELWRWFAEVNQSYPSAISNPLYVAGA